MRLLRPWMRWASLACVVALLTLPVAQTALAVHNLNLFELDADATAGAAAGNDWSSHFPGNNLAGAVTVAFAADAPGSPDTTYFAGGGSKDIRNISQWRFNDNGAPPKDEITNAYAAAYVNATDTGANNIGDLIIFFGADRFAAEGDASIGFWFFLNSVSLDTDGTFNGTHTVGDFLVLSHFTNGGAVPEIKVFKWVGSGGSDGPIDLIFNSGVADCLSGSISSDDPACATVNDSATASPWAYTPKFGNADEFPTGTFFEGGINATRLLGSGCVSTFMAESRSSHEPNATLHDLSGPTTFNTCGSITAKKYHDQNRSGSRDSGEPFLSGWTIFIDKNGDEIHDANGVDNILGNADDEISGSTDTNGAVVFSNLPTGSYSVCEVLQTGWENTDPTGTTLCETVNLGAAGSVTIEFGNAQLYKLIVLTCNQVTNTLVDSTVDLDGNLATTTDTKASLTTPPSGITQAQLCGLGGASYGSLAAGTYTPNVELPDVAPLFP